jgi:hypothetical protein
MLTMVSGEAKIPGTCAPAGGLVSTSSARTGWNVRSTSSVGKDRKGREGVMGFMHP